jgi:hypothetical protein
VKLDTRWPGELPQLKPHQLIITSENFLANMTSTASATSENMPQGLLIVSDKIVGMEKLPVDNLVRRIMLNQRTVKPFIQTILTTRNTDDFIMPSSILGDLPDWHHGVLPQCPKRVAFGAPLIIPPLQAIK